MKFIEAIYSAGLTDANRIADVWIAWDQDADMTLFSDMLKQDGAADLKEARAKLEHATN
jgi:hypothetical protein